MNRESDFDQLLTSWLDEGADVAPERFVWAALEDVERSAQRGAWRTSLEGFFMSLKPAAPILGVAAIAIAGLAVYVALGNPDIGGPTPRTITPRDLPEIILTDANAPDGLAVDATTIGAEALNTPMREGGAAMPSTGFEDALMTNLNSTDAGGYVSWAAVYDSAVHADAAFDVLVAGHESDQGWGLEPISPSPQLGDESKTYSGPAYAFGAARIHMWRVNNLLLAAVFVDVDSVSDAAATQLRSIAELMNDRASGPPSDAGAPNATGTPRVASLDEIVLTEANVPSVTLDHTYRGVGEVLRYPLRSASAIARVAAELDHLTRGHVTELSSPDLALVSWVAEFETEEVAEQALAIYIADFTATEGWGLELTGTSRADGPEGANFEGVTAHFLSGAADQDEVPAQIRVWQMGRLLVAIGVFFEWEEAGIHLIGDNMAARARSYVGTSL